MDKLEKQRIAAHKYTALKHSIKSHDSIMIAFSIMSIVFIGIGSLLLFLRPDVVTTIVGIIFLVVGIFICVTGITTLYSSILYYRDRALMKKLGISTDAKVIAIEAEAIDDDQTMLTVTYQFEYRQQDYEGSDSIDTHGKITMSDFPTYVPIRFLRSTPQKSLIRKQSLASQLKKMRLDEEALFNL